MDRKNNNDGHKVVVSTIYFDKEIDSGSVNDLIGQIERADGNMVVLYFQTFGGTIAAASVFVDWVNTYRLKTLIIIGVGEINSAGFNILTDVTCQIKLLPGSSSIVHEASRDVDTASAKNGVGKFRNDLLKKYNDNRMKKYRSLGFTEYEINTMKAGQDVCLAEPRLREMLNIKD